VIFVNVFKKYVLDAFNQIAEGYTHWRSRPWSEVKDIILKYIDGKRILDIGCGNGRHSYFLLERKINVVGVDASINMLKKYLEKVDFNVKVFLDLVNADGRMLPFRNNIFSGIICIAVLHNIPKRSSRIKFLSECRRVLIYKHFAIITVWTIFQPKLLLKTFIHKLKYRWEFGDIYIPWRRKGRKIYRFYHLYRGREFKKDLKLAGFNIYLFKKIDSRKLLKRNYLVIVY